MKGNNLKVVIFPALPLEVNLENLAIDSFVHAPFAGNVGAEETDASMHAASISLRLYNGVWNALVRDVGLDPTAVVGSFAKELCVLLDSREPPSMLETADSAVRVIQKLQHTLVTQKGMPAGRANVAAKDLVHCMVKSNVALLRAASATLAASAASASASACMVVRVSIRSLDASAIGAGEDRAWFRCTHANVLIVRPGRVTIVEPMASAPLSKVVDAVRRVLNPGITLETRSRHWAPLANLALCTLGAAVLTLTLLVNPELADTQDGITQVTHWVFANQHWLMRGLTTRIQAASPVEGGVVGHPHHHV
jgi:hypothetical protein